MPIIDVQFFCPAEAPPASARVLAEALGPVFGSPPGHTWVRVHTLPTTAYAENGVEVAEAAHPVFVTVLHAHPPVGEALAQQALAITQAVADCAGLPAERVHVQFAPPAAGRQAFGGTLVV